jgi:hypothetical protein
VAGIIDGWISGLAEDEAASPGWRRQSRLGVRSPDFTALLPMLRRAFSSIDRVERRRLLDMLRRPMRTAGKSRRQRLLLSHWLRARSRRRRHWLVSSMANSSAICPLQRKRRLKA